LSVRAGKFIAKIMLASRRPFLCLPIVSDAQTDGGCVEHIAQNAREDLEACLIVVKRNT
jgi:hypothetical protein